MRRRVAASVVGICLAALTGCVALPEAGPVVEVEQSGGSATDTGGAAAIDARPPQEGMSAAEVVKGFLDAMQAWPTELSTAKQFLSSETRSTWSPAGTIVYEDALPPIQAKRTEILQLDDYRDIREDAILVVNLIEPGTAEQQAADNAYTGAMMRGMAQGGYGPMHMGRAVAVEGEHRYRQFVAVYYPGIDHMHAMIGSTFINRVGPGKQLGDTLAVATIPVLAKLGE